MASRVPPRLLTIAGSDSGGGAGIQADLKTFAAHGTYGLSVLTAVTAQNTVAVTAIHEIPLEVVAAQLDAVFSDIGVDAVKIGMLSSAPLVSCVAECLRRYRPRRVVLDPVMIAKSGAALLADDAVAALVSELLPLAHVITPNLPEAARLVGATSLAGEEARIDAARALLAVAAPPNPGPAAADAEPRAVLLKGGHGPGEEVVDLLVQAESVHRFVHPRLVSRATHGTGCTLSAAVAARWASGGKLRDAVEGAIAYVHRAIAAAYPLGQGHGPVNHLYAFPGAP